MKKYFLVIVIISASLNFTGCSPAARFASGKTDLPSKAENQNDSSFDDIVKDIQPDEVTIPLEVETGIASYYADEFHGRPTASGVIYDMYKISAAHPFHPLGTIVRITNLVNNKSVVLEINDRMPYRPDRIIDLSYGAAKELDMLIVGIQKIRIDVLKWGDGKRIERIKNPF